MQLLSQVFSCDFVQLISKAFAVIHVGGTQYKVMPGDNILTHQLNDSVVGTEIVLNKVLLVGTKTWTAIGQPILTQAKVHAIVEEHTLAENVIIFKKKRRKHYRRTKGHRQPITNLRILDITFEGPIPTESQNLIPTSTTTQPSAV